MIEVHNNPAKAVRRRTEPDPDQFDELMQFITKEAEFFERR